MMLKLLILFEVRATKIGKFPLNFPIHGNFSIRRCSWSGRGRRGSKGKSAQQSGICGTAIGTLLNSPDRASFGDRDHGAGNRSAGPLCGRTPLPGSAGGHHPAGQGMHCRHGRGGDLRRRPAVEPDRHRLCRAHRAGRQKPYPRVGRTGGAGALGGARQRRPGPRLRARQPDPAGRRRASGRHLVAPCPRHRPAARSRRPGVDRRLCRRLRGHGADRPRHRPHQRAARLSRAGQHRAVRRRDRRRASAWGSTRRE